MIKDLIIDVLIGAIVGTLYAYLIMVISIYGLSLIAEDKQVFFEMMGDISFSGSVSSNGLDFILYSALVSSISFLAYGLVKNKLMSR